MEQLAAVRPVLRADFVIIGTWHVPPGLECR